MAVDNFPATLAQAKLTTRDDNVDFVKEIHFDNKLKNTNKKTHCSNKNSWTNIRQRL